MHVISMSLAGYTHASNSITFLKPSEVLLLIQYLVSTDDRKEHLQEHL